MSKHKLAIGLILILGLLVNAVALGADLSYQVDRSEDDAFKTEAGGYFESSPYVAITDPNYGLFSYFLFRNVTIYNSRIINNATLSVYTTSGQDADLAVSATIYGLEVDSGGLLNPLSTTTALVNWNLSQVRGIGVWHNVTVTSIIQELIDRYGWDYGDNLAFEILATSGTLRQAVAFDYGTPPLAAMLYLIYGEAPPPPPGLPPGAEYNQTVEGYDIYKVPGFGQVTTFTSSMMWDDSGEVYPFQGKTAYVNTTDTFYVFGTKGDKIGYHFRDRLNLTWSDFITLYEHLSGSDIYTDFFVDRFGKLHVGWIWTWTNDAYYMKFDLLSDGSAVNYTGRQLVDDFLIFYGPVVIAADSEGYPYMAYDQRAAANYGGRIAWSILNNGTWLNNANSPESSEINLGVNPPNLDWFTHELVPMGNRRMNLIVNSPNPPTSIYTCSKRNHGSANAWIGEGEFSAGDRQTPLNRVYAISGASIMNYSDEHDAWAVRYDASTNDLWKYSLGSWAKQDDDYGGNNITAMIADHKSGQYVALSYKNGQNYTHYAIIYKNHTLSAFYDLRIFPEVIGDWELVTNQNPQRKATLNQTIISYAWRDDANITFYHDWFYLEDGPSDTVTGPSWIAYNDGPPLECDTLDCLIDLIEGEDPDPQDPEPSPWEGSPELFSRFAIRRYFLFIGWGMFWGPIWFFCYRRPSGYLIGAAFIFMLIGLGLLLQIPYI